MSEDNPKFGGGSGGDGTNTKDEFRLIDGTFSVTANQLELVSRPPMPPASSKPCLISLLATDMETMKGSVNLHGMAGVNITAGLPPLPQMDQDTQGVLVWVDEMSKVTIKRGLIPEVDQVVEMTSSGITVDGGSQPVTVKSMQKITLSVLEGMSTIELSPESIKISFGMGISTIELGPAGIKVQGLPLVQIN